MHLDEAKEDKKLSGYNYKKMKSIENKILKINQSKSNFEKSRIRTSLLFKVFLMSFLVFVLAMLASWISFLAFLTSSVMPANSSGGAIIFWRKWIFSSPLYFLVNSLRLWTRRSFVQHSLFFCFILSLIDDLALMSSFNLILSSTSPHFSRSSTVRSADLMPAIQYTFLVDFRIKRERKREKEIRLVWNLSERYSNSNDIRKSQKSLRVYQS